MSATPPCGPSTRRRAGRRVEASGKTGLFHDAGELAAVQAWAQRIGLPQQTSYVTDTLGFIGRLYLERELGHRVCQIYCDSRQWDTSAYPPEFFDTVLIDGGHQREIVISDTRKALPLLRSGGSCSGTTSARRFSASSRRHGA